MIKILETIAEKYNKLFGNFVIDSDRADYPEELNYQASKYFYLVILGLLAMFLYIRQDWIIHPRPVFSSALRIGFCFVSAAVIIMKMSGYYRDKTSGLFTVIMAYHCIMIAVIAGTAGEFASPYISGFAFVMMIFIIVPIVLKLKIIIYTSAIVVFLIVGTGVGLDFSKNDVRYSFNDLLSAYGVCLLFSHTIDYMRFTSWKQRKELQSAIKLNEKNIVEMRELAIEAEAANKAKSGFLANMSHEIRTPLNAILGIVEIEMQGEAVKEERKEALERIYDSGNLLLNIINDVLDLSKIEAGKMELVPVMYDIPSLINDVAQVNSLRYEYKKIEFSLDIDANTPVNLYGDELRVKQILNNILSNAFKYTEKGAIKMSVYPEPSDDGEPAVVTLVFAISDTGQGMEPSQVQSLFDEYSRFNTEANRTTTGTGLGMTITKRFADMMGGKICVKSEAGVGSTFTVHIPQERVDSLVCGSEMADKLRDYSFHNTSLSKKIGMVREYMPYGRALVVDDVESNIYVARGMLLPYGLQIDTASNGFEAIQKIQNGGVYDIIFMDHIMPKMDGIETTKAIRGMGYDGAVVALTANALVGQAERFLREGFDGFISKPIDSRDIDAALIKFIRNRQPSEVIEAAYREQSLRAVSPEKPVPESVDSETAELEELFIIDAEEAINQLEGMNFNSDIQNYETIVHGMKSALANIKETELSDFAHKLEQAALEKNIDLIRAETPAFIDALSALSKKLRHLN